ncbi:MAG: addiction module protein [Bryobacteraceae bacterium]
MQNAPLPEPPGFAELSKVERIKYLQELWDRIAESPGELPPLESHLQLAEERLIQHRRVPAGSRPANDVIGRLAKSAKTRQ